MLEPGVDPVDDAVKPSRERLGEQARERPGSGISLPAARDEMRSASRPKTRIMRVHEALMRRRLGERAMASPASFAIGGERPFARLAVPDQRFGIAFPAERRVVDFGIR